MVCIRDDCVSNVLERLAETEAAMRRVRLGVAVQTALYATWLAALASLSGLALGLALGESAWDRLVVDAACAVLASLAAMRVTDSMFDEWRAAKASLWGLSNVASMLRMLSARHAKGDRHG
jgi:hypothetical protein